MTAHACLSDGIPAWELAEMARLDAKRCPDCGQLPPEHLITCARARMPDPGAPRCPVCQYPAGTLGCRIAPVHLTIDHRRRP
jgi:hypothetical protein